MAIIEYYKILNEILSRIDICCYFLLAIRVRVARRIYLHEIDKVENEGATGMRKKSENAHGKTSVCVYARYVHERASLWLTGTRKKRERERLRGGGGCSLGRRN